MNIHVRIIPAVLLISFMLLSISGCTKNGADSNTEDALPPDVSIQNPTVEYSYLSLNNTISLGGMATDNVGVTSVTWSGDNGAGGAADGTTEWTIGAIPLNAGDNRITVTAHDQAGNNQSDEIMVVYNPDLTFWGIPYLSQNGIFINVETPVIIRVTILPNANLDPASVKLLRVNQQGQLIQELGSLYDDGNLDHGDEILGDGVFSTQQTFLETSVGALYLRVQATTNMGGQATQNYSQVMPLYVVEDVPESVANDIVALQQAGSQQYQSYAQSHTPGESAIYTADWMKQQSGVVNAVVTATGDVWMQYDYNLTGVILTNMDGNEGGAPAGNLKTRATAPKINLAGQTRGLTKTPARGISSSNPNAVLDKNVLLYAPYYTQYSSGGTEFLDNVDSIVNNSQYPNFNTPVYLKDAEATVEALDNLAQYGLIVVHTHGALTADNQVVFASGELYTYYAPHVFKWLTGQLTVATMGSTTYWAAKPGYISGLDGNMPHSIIYVGACGSAYNPTLANAFINKGANTFYGFTQTVQSWFDAQTAGQLLPNLIVNHMTTGQAFTPGQHDNNIPPAYFDMTGNPDTYFATSLVNGDFESGDLTGWTPAGDGRVISQLATIPPYEGAWMGIISTGLGFTDSTGSFTQNFFINPGQTTLTVNWNLMSEEFMEWVGSPYQDYFQIKLIDQYGTENLIFYKDIDDIAAEYNLTYLSPEIIFDEGDVWGTGWQTFTYDLTPLAGTGVTLHIGVGDIGDSQYDTVVLLDDVKVQ